MAFSMEIVKQDGIVFQGEVRSARLPGHDGYFGVLSSHAPMIAQVGIGEVKVVTFDDETRYFAVGGGVCEVGGNHLAIIVRSAEAAEDIHVDRAEQAAQRARQRLAEAKQQAEIEADRAQLALARALARLRVAGQRPT